MNKDNTNEQALEAAIQKCLTGVSLETLKEEGTSEICTRYRAVLEFSRKHTGRRTR